MTIEPEQKRLIEVATATGWTDVTVVAGYVVGRPPQKPETFCRVPDLVEDLNAIAAVRKTLTRNQQERFIDALREVLNDANRAAPFWLGPTPFHYVNASAAEQAQALHEALKIKS